MDSERLRESLFPGVPPYHVFLPPWKQFSEPVASGLRQEEWQFPAQILPVVRDTVEHAGFKVVKGVLRCEDEKEVITTGFIWDNLPLVEKEMDAIDFGRLREAVKINKFPGFRDLNRKDLLWKNFRRMQALFGREEFGFHPDTFKLPLERKQLVTRMKDENFESVYIVKLPNNYCGIGACIINHPKKIPRKTKVHQERSKKVVKEDPIIVQKYISNPYLINGYKFDFRIYVLITSVDPLRIYLYKEGLVRFATEKFSLDSESLDNTFIHLTNFTVNKKGDTVTDYPPGCQVNKWKISDLWKYMRERGTDPTPFWEEVKDVVIKTVLCARDNIYREVVSKSTSFYNNFNLLGLDIFIDNDLRPHLLEVNTIPSLFINTISKEIDTTIKAPMIAEMFNICGHHISASGAKKHRQNILSTHLPNYTNKILGFDHRLYVRKLLPEEERKQEHFLRAFTDRYQAFQSSSFYYGNKQENANSKAGDNMEEEVEEEEEEEEEEDEEEEEEEEDDDLDETSNEDSTDPNSVSVESEKCKPQKKGVGRVGSANTSNNILDSLTPCDVRVLVHSEDELCQTQTFERIFPRYDTEAYLDFMSTPSYYDLLLSAWEHRYADRPREGLERIIDECSKGVHLIVPESEKKIKVERRSPKPFKKSNYNVPHIFKDK